MQLHEILKYQYAGCGWFRDAKVPVGQTANIIHGPVLLQLIQEHIASELPTGNDIY